ncbi:ROK family transcriptional regulator (plasmid) [Deinococcus actinosclerus]|nr:ROK family transcriptional regulator [Deinococcus actinosclerus]
MSQPNALRRHNRRQVLELILDRGGLTRPLLAQHTGLSQVTVNAVVQQLLDERVVHLSRGAQQTPGRAAQVVSPAPDLGTVVAIDLQPDMLSAQIMSLADQSAVSLIQQVAPADLTQASADLVRTCAHDARFGPLRGVLIGLPAPVDAAGELGEPNAVPHLDVAALRRLGVPVWFENDANLVALAAHAGSPQLTHLAALVERASGTGMGFILGGVLYRGVQGRAGELGRTPWPHREADVLLEQLSASARLSATAYLVAGLCHALDLERVVLSLRGGRGRDLAAQLKGLLPPAVQVVHEPDAADAARRGAAACAVRRCRDRLLAGPESGPRPRGAQGAGHVA